MAASLYPLRLVLTGLAAAGAVPAHAADELPDGSGPAFRNRMMAWSAPAAVPAPVVPRVSRKTGVLPHLSSRFGYRSDPIRGVPRMHSGIDIPGHSGTPIHASASGTVNFAGWAGGYGRMVEIRHGNGLSTRYAHLSQILVSPGMAVGRGQTIALMGSTGRSTGSHLHFEVRVQGRATNPLAYLAGDTPPPPNGFAPYAVPATPSEPHVSRFAQARAAASGHSEKF